ncbi:hypothetical protein GCM10027169_28570 [Gordonia jinhuaensis]|uniref:Lipoprotein n=1 Tax=Gordonia jinhuaensis TaxID=1517702 RepID=A0A916T9A4_9ACTN|nr:hypothetical protein [Gordonia jinhuaensis]GGB36520.1 hypothetical protein GCM10011489_25530 [Gordonia jinhuaensis]
MTKRFATMLAATSLLGVCAMTACSTPSTPTPSSSSAAITSNINGPYQLPDNIGTTFRWTAAPGIDLLSPIAVVTRAFIESDYIKTISQFRGAYPGWYRVVAGQPRFMESATRYVAPVNGTVYHRLQKVQRLPHNEWSTVACTYKYDATTTRQPDGRFLALRHSSYSTEILWRQTSDSKIDYRAVGQGTARYPVTDVFTGWTVIRSAPQHIEDISAAEACRDPRNDPAPYGTHRTEETYVDQPAEALPPYPGWARAGD